jgi:hypothetical protein
MATSPPAPVTAAPPGWLLGIAVLGGGEAQAGMAIRSRSQQQGRLRRRAPAEIKGQERRGQRGKGCSAGSRRRLPAARISTVARARAQGIRSMSRVGASTHRRRPTSRNQGRFHFALAPDSTKHGDRDVGLGFSWSHSLAPKSTSVAAGCTSPTGLATWELPVVAVDAFIHLTRR